MSAYPYLASAQLCIPLAPDRVLVIPTYIPLSIIVIVLVLCGSNVSAATTALLAIGTAVRELQHPDAA